MKKIFIVGRAKGMFRSQNLMKYLLDKNYSLYYNSLTNDFYKKSNGIKKIIRKLLRSFEEFWTTIFEFYQIIISDIVVVPAMNNEQQKHLFFAHFLRKKILTDFYISDYDTYVNDWQRIPSYSKAAKKLLKNDFNIINKADFTLFLNYTEANRYLDIVNIPFNSKKHLIVPLVIEEMIKCKLPYFSAVKSKKLNICWWGNYLPLHGLENILKACEILKNEDKEEFHFYLFGNNEKGSIPYQKMITSLGISDYVTISNDKTFSNGKLKDFLEVECDLVLGHFGDSLKAKNVLGNKLLDGVAMKAPLLTGESAATREYFSDEEIFFSSNVPVDIARKITEISRFKQENINERVDRAYNIFLENFSETAFRRNLDRVFEKLD